MMQGTTLHREKGQNMAEPQETRQEQETRWDAQRVTRDKAFQAGQHARHKKNRRTWLIVAVIVIIIVVIAAVVLR
jgi:t-SNARE complex subunit (syntaxin)